MATFSFLSCRLQLLNFSFINDDDNDYESSNVAPFLRFYLAVTSPLFLLKWLAEKIFWADSLSLVSF